MTQKKEIKRVNPKWLLRQILKSLPAEAWVRSTVAALWTFCNDFIREEDIANGTVGFSGTVAYSQLAQLLAIGESTAKWRMKHLRDEYQLVEWEGTKFGVKFTISISLSGTPGAYKRCDDTQAWRMPLTPAQQTCQRSTGHTWTDYRHTTQQCSACGTFRTNPKPLQWRVADDLEAEYMAWVEEDAPDYWVYPFPPYNSMATYESVDPPPSAAFLQYLEGE
jgi:hypothetical protein